MSESETDHLSWYMKRYRALERDEISDSTFDARESQIEMFRNWWDGDLAEVSDNDIEDYVMHLSAEGYSSNTISTRRWALSKFYRQMHAKGRIEKNPMEEVPWKDISVATGKSQKKLKSDDNERIYPLSPVEVRQLRDNVTDPKIRNELLIRLLAQTGMRAHEVANLTLDRVHPNSRHIEVKDEKTGDKRDVVYQPSLDTLMDQWLNRGHREVYTSAKDSNHLFVSRKSGSMDNDLVNDVVKKAAENAGIQEVVYKDAAGNKRYKITAHTLRHTFATHALDPDMGGGQMNLRYLQEVLGHADITTTQIYLDYVGESAVDDMRERGPSFVEK